jgi:hypothetical protein
MFQFCGLAGSTFQEFRVNTGSSSFSLLTRETLPAYLSEAGLPWRFEGESLGALSFHLDYGGGVTLVIQQIRSKHWHEIMVSADLSATEDNDQTRRAIHRTRQALCPIFVEFGLYDEKELRKLEWSFNLRQMNVLNLLVKKYRKRGELQWDNGNAVVQYNQTTYTIMPDGNYSKT